MRSLLFLMFSVIFTFGFNQPALSIQPSNQLHQSIYSRILEIDNNLSVLEENLKGANLTANQIEDIGQLKQNLLKEKKLLKEQSILFKKLENKGLLIFLNPGLKKPTTNTEAKPAK